MSGLEVGQLVSYGRPLDPHAIGARVGQVLKLGRKPWGEAA